MQRIPHFLHTIPHYICIFKHVPVLSQMSDTEVGGATVFPDIGAALPPKRVSKPSSLFSI